MQEVKTRAIVSVIVEVSVGNWGSDCKMSQVYQQAKETAILDINNVIKSYCGMRIIGTPTVETITTSNTK